MGITGLRKNVNCNTLNVLKSRNSDSFVILATQVRPLLIIQSIHATQKMVYPKCQCDFFPAQGSNKGIRFLPVINLSKLTCTMHKTITHAYAKIIGTFWLCLFTHTCVIGKYPNTPNSSSRTMVEDTSTRVYSLFVQFCHLQGDWALIWQHYEWKRYLTDRLWFNFFSKSPTLAIGDYINM